MEAANKGAAEAGGSVIGVTCTEIERWRDIRANRWVGEEWNKATLIERLQSLIEGSRDAAKHCQGVSFVIRVLQATDDRGRRAHKPG